MYFYVIHVHSRSSGVQNETTMECVQIITERTCIRDDDQLITPTQRAKKKLLLLQYHYHNYMNRRWIFIGTPYGT